MEVSLAKPRRVGEHEAKLIITGVVPEAARNSWPVYLVAEWQCGAGWVPPVKG